jgi:hypothetical protein
MRSVMEIGGACADGGPFVPVRSCPKGAPLLIVGGIWFGLIFAGVYAWTCVRHGVPSFLGLVWPALFLSLGWNFLEFGLDPPGPGGLEWGWLVCAVVFFVMGGVPLPAVLPALWRRLTGRTPPSRLREMLLPRRARSAASTGSGSSRWIGWEAASATTAATSTTAAPTPDRPGDLVTSLERLDELHRSGALDDDEYDEAKRRILEAGGS